MKGASTEQGASTGGRPPPTVIARIVVYDRGDRRHVNAPRLGLRRPGPRRTKQKQKQNNKEKKQNAQILV